MPVRVVFRCEFCSALPDPDTYASLEREHDGTVGDRVWAMGPHPWAGRRGTDRARRLARGGGGFAR